MRRRIFFELIGAAAIGLGIYGWLTEPVTTVAEAITGPAYTPNLANGLVVFNAGGCASCHAVPDQPDRLKLGGGLAYLRRSARSTRPTFRRTRPMASAVGAKPISSRR